MVRLHLSLLVYSIFFFFNDTATTEIYTLSLHDALPIYKTGKLWVASFGGGLHEVNKRTGIIKSYGIPPVRIRSEEHTSELQSRQYLVCRLLLEKKKTQLTRS